MTQLEILRIIAYVGGLIAVGVIVATPIVIWAKREADRLAVDTDNPHGRLRAADPRPAAGGDATGEPAMTLTAVIALFVFIVCIAALAVLWDGGIADVVEDDGEYND